MSMEIDNENKLREIPVSQPMFLNNFSDKVYLVGKEADHKLPKPFEGPSSTKVNFLSNQDDFGLLDHHHHHGNFSVHGSSQNPNVGFQTGSKFDAFDAFSYGSSSSTNMFYDYDIKPFNDSSFCHQIFGHAQVMDNSQTGGYFLEPNHAIAMHFHEAEPLNFAVPREERLCVRASQDYYKKVGINNNTNNNNNNKHSGGDSMSNLNKNIGATSYGRSTFEKSRKKSTETKGQWIPEEDRLLVQLVEEHGIKKWSVVARMLPGRIGKQCRERWHNHLRPDIKKDTWSEDEDRMIIQAHKEIGNKWAEIAKRLPGRTENSIKNHWNATKRKQYSKRKCRSKYPRGSLLQDYIKSLNLDLSPAAAATATNEPIPPEWTAPIAPSEEEPDFCMNDRLVPSFDFDEVVPDLEFDDKIFRDSCCNIEAFLDDIPCAPVNDNKSFGVEDVPIDDMAPVLVGEGGKKGIGSSGDHL